MVSPTEPYIKDDIADDQKWRRLVEALVSAIEKGELDSMLSNQMEHAHEDNHDNWSELNDR